METTAPLPRPHLTLGLAGTLVLAATSTALAAEPAASFDPNDCFNDNPGVVGTIDHPTDPTAIVLRMTVAGGFLPVGFALVDGPTFVLYGNDVVIYRPQPEGSMAPAPGEPWEPYRCALLSPEQVDELLGFALEEGGLADARDLYPQPFVADAPDTVFEIDAGGVRKTVVVQALGAEEGLPAEDVQARVGFAALADLLTDFQAQVDAGHTLGSAVYQPEAYRGILAESYQTDTSADIAWPWSDLAPNDFVADPQGFASYAPLTPAQAEQVTAVPSGGVVGILVTEPSGTVVDLGIRPILPGEPTLPA